MKGFSIIVAFDKDRGIGKDGVLPWHLPADLKHFKEITTAPNASGPNVVIMGRKTWESIPQKYRPLSDRLNVVVSTQLGYALPSGVKLESSLESALKTYCAHGYGEVFVIGGARVFAEAIKHPWCEKLYLTLIEGGCGADVFFPEVPLSFLRVSQSGKMTENEKTFSFLKYSQK